MIKEKNNIKKKYSYTTSDTKYILPSDFCTVHTVSEVLPPVFPPDESGVVPGGSTENPLGNGGMPPEVGDSYPIY